MKSSDQYNNNEDQKAISLKGTKGKGSEAREKVEKHKFIEKITRDFESNW